MTETQRYFYSGEDRRQNRDSDNYFNAQFGAKPVYIKPAEFQITDQPNEMIVATVGTGILIAIADKDLKTGGMAHIMLTEKAIASFPYFAQIDEKELATIVKPFEECLKSLKNKGAGKNRMRIRLIGGAIFPAGSDDRGTKTHVFVKEYLTRKGLSIMSEDVAGPYIRRVHYFPHSGRAVRRVLRRKSDFARIEEEEREFRDNQET